MQGMFVIVIDVIVISQSIFTCILIERVLNSSFRKFKSNQYLVCISPEFLAIWQDFVVLRLLSLAQSQSLRHREASCQKP